MKLTQIEGDPEEVARYMQLVEPSADGEVASGDEAGDEVTRFIRSQGRDPQLTQLVEDYTREVLEVETLTVRFPRSTAKEQEEFRLKDLQCEPAMGAIVFVRPKDGMLSFRLRANEVEDLPAPPVIIRDLANSDHRYPVRLALRTSDDVPLALELTRRALASNRLSDMFYGERETSD
jgi:hypothetical protein